MNSFDLFIFLPVALGLIVGFFKGFVKELVSFTAIIAALLAAEMFVFWVAVWVSDFLNVSEKTGKTVAYLLIFTVVLIAMFVLSKFIQALIKRINLGWLNSLAGGILGALKYALIISVMMNVFDALDSRFQFAKKEKKEESVGYYPILKLAPSLWKESKKIYDQQQNNSKDSTKTNISFYDNNRYEKPITQ
ncbi:MAG: CvpA family protein [Paludibacteraceae bacterium]